ncbi:hypothetical protein CH275_26975 [Rhodococcus sp. 06-235-1A]|uniref:hypothetical protein n=1 Tax=Rhodococcus sp. 06-235-1A TaxID=2022508 RepID=UPI000B9BE660|nr:hypothetical protein [Rhodococcus sp. 06-235-1A]OZC95425.1 hypothetical protein CH275_26975 [Rhodococcus sp. 06-235-1A]
MQATLAERLNELFDTHTDANGKPLSARRFLESFNAQSSATLSLGYLSELRNGVSDNPRVQLVVALANYFGVPPSFLVDLDEVRPEPAMAM